MKAKFGSIVVAGRGKIGGHVASQNRAGAYFRTKVTPINPQSSFQNLVRARLTDISKAWRLLTEAQRVGWNAAVQSFAQTDVFGDLRNPSGLNLYVKLNSNLQKIGLASISSAPNPAGVAKTNIVSLTAVVTGGVVTLTMSGAVPAGVSLVVEATAPQSAGVSFVKSEFRIIKIVAAAGVAAVVLTTEYAGKFGVYLAGQKLFVRASFVNIVTGQESGVQTISAIAA
jgi:hypothetical protein